MGLIYCPFCLCVIFVWCGICLAVGIKLAVYRVFQEVLPPLTEHVPGVIWKKFSNKIFTYLK